MHHVMRPLIVALALVLFLGCGALMGTKLPAGKLIFVATQGTVYRVDDDPLTGWPLPLPIWRETAQGHSAIDSLIIGPSGYLYLSEPFMHRIIRLKQDGSDETVIVSDQELHPSTLALDVYGNLLFSTRPQDGCAGLPEGIWLIEDGLPSSPPRLIIPPDGFVALPEIPNGCLSSIVHCFPTSSRPNDLLVGPLMEWASGWAIGPGFEDISPAVAYAMVSTDYDVAILSPGSSAERLLVSDYELGRISEFSMDGEFLRIFADLKKVNSIATDSDGYVYATRCWKWTRQSGRNSVVVFLPNGTQLIEFSLPGAYGIAVVERP